jgi:hypothetical protein
MAGKGRERIEKAMTTAVKGIEKAIAMAVKGMHAKRHGGERAEKVV